MPSDSGTILLIGDVIRYEASTVHRGFELPVKDVLVIGERTDATGPFADDYFLCFGVRGGGLYEASFYAAGRDEFLRDLSARVGFPLEFELVTSTDWAHRILWPREAAGKPLFKSVPNPDATLWDRVKLLSWRVSKEVLSDEVAAILNKSA